MRESLNISIGGIDSSLKKLADILDKNYEMRTGGEIVFINEFIKQNYRLGKLAEDISLDFVKNIMKMAEVANIVPGKRIFEKD